MRQSAQGGTLAQKPAPNPAPCVAFCHTMGFISSLRELRGAWLVTVYRRTEDGATPTMVVYGTWGEARRALTLLPLLSTLDGARWDPGGVGGEAPESGHERSRGQRAE
jgi:hypothetical protein